MDKIPEADWAKLPDSMQLKSGVRKNHTQYENLEEGLIPVPTPFRVKSGSFGKDHLSIVTSNKTVKIDWQDVEIIALGIICEEMVLGKVPKSAMRRVIRQYLLGDDEKVQKKKELKEIYLLDIYVKDLEAPYRIDQTSVNYKTFLKSPGYVSQLNFRRLANNILSRATSAKVNQALAYYVEKSKEKIRRHQGGYDFEVECQIMREHQEGLIDQCDVKIPPENEGW